MKFEVETALLDHYTHMVFVAADFLDVYVLNSIIRMTLSSRD